MTSWTAHGPWLACLLWIGPTLAAEPPAPSRGPEEIPCRDDEGLLRTFRQVHSLQATFTDRRQIDLLDEPLVSRGRLHYRRPDRLRYVVESPGRQEIVVVGSRVTVSRPDLGRSRALDLQTSEVARAVVSSLVQVLGGRLDLLEADYRCLSRRRETGWEVRLAPRGAPLDRVVREIGVRIAWDGGVREIQVHETNGDSSRMTIEEVQINLPFDLDEEKTDFAP